MPRKREGSVTESLEELRELEGRYRGKSEQVRITVLRLLKEDAERGIEDVAMLVGYSKPTVKRWWRVYREGGMEALIGLGGGGKRLPTPDDGLSTLKHKLLSGELSSVEDVREWLGTSVHATNGNSGSSAKGSQTGALEKAIQTSALISESPISSQALLRFIATLPMSHLVQEWSEQFRKALQMLVGDVDRISLSINVQCELLNPVGSRPEISIAQSVTTGTIAADPLDQNVTENAGRHSERFLDNLRRRKFPFAEYHTPHSFEYYHLDQAYIGVIVLWRDRSKPDISEKTLEIMEKLQKFLAFLISDFVARHQLARPIEHVFHMTLDGLTRETGLTVQERRIIILQLLGLSYEELANTLNISLNTVRYHLRSIYNKTGAHSQAELFAKYFTPRIDPDPSPE